MRKFSYKNVRSLADFLDCIGRGLAWALPAFNWNRAIHTILDIFKGHPSEPSSNIYQVPYSKKFELQKLHA